MERIRKIDQYLKSDTLLNRRIGELTRDIKVIKNVLTGKRANYTKHSVETLTNYLSEAQEELNQYLEYKRHFVNFPRLKGGGQ